MKLLLIEPANQLVIQNRKKQFFNNLVKKNYYTVPPLALGILAGLTPYDWEVKILQEPGDVIDFDEQSDLIGISAVTHTAKRGYEIAEQFRLRGRKVIMGGIHPTALPDEALQYCDSVCIGEAESIWNEILNDFRKGELKRKYKAKDAFNLHFYATPRRDLMPSLKSFVFNPGVSIEASRGCPYDCDFCSVSLSHGKKIRYRPVDNIIANFNYAKELFRAMIPLKRKWTGQSTISIVKDRELLKLASDSGCNGLLIGIESVTDEGFKHYNKSLPNFNELKEAIKTLKEHHIGVLAHMVFGNDFDTREGIRESINRLMELDIATASLGIVVPYPGTRLFEELNNQHRIITRDWNYYDIHHLVFNPMNFSTSDFLEDMGSIRSEFFSYANIFKRTWGFKSLDVLGISIHSRLHNKVGDEKES